MKTKLSLNNPFSCSRYAFAFEKTKEDSYGLDYGCYDASFLHKTKSNKKSVRLVGIDKNLEVIEKNPYNEELYLFEDTIPFKKDSFDVVYLLDVIEHIHNQEKTLRDINKVMKMGASLIVTVPKKHIFSFLDFGNYKFVFPGLHKLFYTFKFSAQAYEERYLNNPNGLIGDIEKEKSWHQHFTESELENLLKECGFVVKVFDGSSYFGRVFSLFDKLKLGRLFSKELREKECKSFSSMNLFCEAVKVS